MKLINAFRAMPLTIFLSVLLGLALSLGSAGALQVYDSLFPVVSMTGEVVSVRDDSVVVHITGTKNRDCIYGGMQAYSVNGEGEMHDAFRERIGSQETGRTKPVGVYDIGFWRVWPTTSSSTGVRIFVQHFCSGRVVLTNVADVSISLKGTP